MQFYLDGYKPGDPDILTAELPRAVDVLIVGSGPAGALLAAQMSTFPGISTRLVERLDGPLQVGQADGVACRTVEMFDAFGLSGKLLREAYWVNETVFWRPSKADRSRIERTGRVQDTEDGLSEFPHLIVNQARMQKYLLDYMRNSPTRLEPNHGLEFVDLKVETEGEHPVVVTLRKVANGAETTVRAKYVVGCDGARSRVRVSIGAVPHGDFANHAWGVVDMLAVTDFPDIRLKAAIQSADEGNILLIPREGGYMVRLYVDLGEIDPNKREAFRENTQEMVIGTAQRVLRPYTLDVKSVAWFAVYQVGQRVTDRFDDVPADQADSRRPRVFIAGDACHTHSAKAGQGMNVSMQDTFNLGWKLISVLEGRAKPELLRTYTVERHTIAQGLIDFEGMVENHGLAAERFEPPGTRRPRPGRASGLFREVGSLHRGCRDALPAGDGSDRRGDPPESCQGLHNRHAFPIRTCRAPRRRQAGAPRARCPCRWRLAHLRLCRREWAASAQARRLLGGVPEFSDPPVHPGGREHRQRDRCSRGLPTGAPRPQGRRAPVDSASAQGALRAYRLREGLLPRPQERSRHLRAARHPP